MTGNLLTGPNGEELILVFDHDGLIAAEDAADKPIVALVDGAFQGRLGYITALLYGGLRRKHPNLTMADTKALMEKARQANSMDALMLGMVKAIEAAMPKKEANADPQKAPGNGTGTPSSEPGAKKASTRKRSTV